MSRVTPYNWFQLHLNLSWLFALLLRFAFIPLQGTIAVIALIVFYVLFVATTFWVLHRKKQNLAWVVFPLMAVLLSNKREIRPISAPDDIEEEVIKVRSGKARV